MLEEFPKCLISSSIISPVIGLIRIVLTAQNETWCGAEFLKGEMLKEHTRNPFNRFLITFYIDITFSFLTASVLMCTHRLLILPCLKVPSWGR
jgi:hypothetical protein